MIATAWYDLSSRLQSNHFVLQRRNENPKSWLNKQRQLVNGKQIPFDECDINSSLPDFNDSCESSMLITVPLATPRR